MDILGKIAGFDWDRGNRNKCRKHGVSIEAIESVFDRLIAAAPDAAHSQEEDRFIAIGKTNEGRGVFLVFTLRERQGKRFIRPVSARFMHRKELDYYEKEVTDTEI